MEPTVGARCAVLFNSEQDYFGTRADQRMLECWLPATVERVQRTKQTITARFDDGAVSTLVPYSEVSLLRQGDNATIDDRHLDYWSPISNTTGPATERVFSNHSPHELHPGDLVSALFQQDQRADIPNARFIGRVLATRIVVVNKIEWKLADIGYEDGDCERNVPYDAGPHGSSSVSLLQRGIDHPSWLDGLVVPLPSERFPACLTGLIVSGTTVTTAVTDTQRTRRSKNNNTPAIMKTIQYECNGKKALEQHSYDAIVTALVEANLGVVATLPVKSSVDTLAGSSQPLPLPQTTHHINKGRKLPVAALDHKGSQNTPAHTGRPIRRAQVASQNYCDDDNDDDDDDDMNDDLDLAAFAKKIVALRTVKACTKHPGQAKSLREATSERSDECSDDEMAESDLVDSVKHQTTRKSSRIKREQTAPLPREAPIPSRKAPRQLAKRNTRACRDHDNVQAVAETMWHLEIDEVIPPPSLPIRSIHNSMAHHLGMSLDSCDAAGASDLLLFMGAMHGRMPNDKLWKSLLALNCLGPSSDGKHFPDVHKMDICSTYLKFVFSKQGMIPACLSHIDQQFALNHNGVSFADMFMSQMMGEYYTLKKDALCVSDASVTRTWQSAHAKACFAEVFVTLLEHQLVPCIIADREGKSVNYQTLPIIRDIIVSRRGAKDALEKTVRACTYLWTQYGPLVVCNVKTDETEQEHLDQDLLGLALDSVVRLLDSLGIVISCLAWIYGKEAHEDADALADICSQTMFHELSGTDLSQMKPWLSDISEEKLFDKIKLRFVLSLHTGMIPQVRPKLADRLEIADLYNLILGW